MPKSWWVVVSGDRDGAGRTTIAASLATAMLRGGRSVGVVDLNARDRALTQWVRARARAVEKGVDLPVPIAPSLAPRRARRLDVVEDECAEAWPDMVASLDESCDVVIVDAALCSEAAMRPVHEQADIVLTVAAEGTADLDSLMERDGRGEETGRPDRYGQLVWEARRRRAYQGRPAFDWILVRNRCLPMTNPDWWASRWERAQNRLGARRGPAIAESPVWRSGFDLGLTVFDPPNLDAERAAEARQALTDLMIVMDAPSLSSGLGGP